ncbi:MAG: hypothetical protein AB1458_05735 [Bacteroidota bacterium]
MNPKPRYLLLYRCSACGQESGYTERDTPVCRYCDEKAEMSLLSKKEITPELMAEYLKALSDKMLANLRSAYEKMTEEDKASFPKGMDPEQQMLMLLAKAKKLRDDIQGMELKESGKKDDPPDPES